MPMTMVSGLIVSEIPSAVENWLRHRTELYISLIIISFGSLLNGSPCTVPLVTSFRVRMDLSTSGA